MDSVSGVKQTHDAASSTHVLLRLHSLLTERALLKHTMLIVGDMERSHMYGLDFYCKKKNKNKVLKPESKWYKNIFKKNILKKVKLNKYRISGYCFTIGSHRKVSYYHNIQYIHIL